MFPHDITVYRNENGLYKRYWIHGVLWQDTNGIAKSKSGLKDDNTLELYIPFLCGFKPLKNDFVIKGIINYQVDKKPSELFSIGEVRTITVVDEFDFGSLRHYKVGGK